MTLLEWVAAVAVVLGSAIVLWAVKSFDDIAAKRWRPTAVPRHPRQEAPDRRAA